MKKIILLMLIVLTIFLGACGGKNVDEVYQELSDLVNTNGKLEEDFLGVKQVVLELSDDYEIKYKNDSLVIYIEKNITYYAKNGEKREYYGMNIEFSVYADKISDTAYLFYDILDFDIYSGVFSEYIKKGKLSPNDEMDEQICAYIESSLNELDNLLNSQYGITLK